VSEWRVKIEQNMTAPAYHLPPGAVESVEAGEVIYLTPAVALVPADVAAAGEAAVRALEDAADAAAVADWRARCVAGERPEPWDPSDYCICPVVLDPRLDEAGSRFQCGHNAMCAIHGHPAGGRS